jgi:hypothetical protein
VDAGGGREDDAPQRLGRKRRFPHLRAATGRRGHDPPQPRIGRDRARERRRIDIRDAEQASAESTRSSKRRCWRACAGRRGRRTSRRRRAWAEAARARDHLDARLELLDQSAEVLRSGTAATARSVRTA